MKISNSARLSFQLVNEQDSEFLYQVDHDPKVMHFINGGIMTSREDIENKFIPRHNTYKNPDKGWGLWKVTVIENQSAIGWVLVRPMSFFSEQPQYHDIELGWRFMQHSWGKGYATEAARHILQALAENKQYQYFSAIADPDNHASIAVMKKLGMQYITQKVVEDRQLGDMDVVLYQLENSD